MKYLLPCGQCGEKLAIETSQAGEQVACRCGARLEVPSLREIRSLEAAQETAAVRRRQWNPTRGVVFAFGLVVAVAGLIITAAAAISLTQAQVPEMVVPDVDQELTQIDKLGLAETWDLWTEMQTNGLGPYYLPPKYAVMELRRWLTRVLTGGLVVLAMGALMIGSAYLLPQPARKAPPGGPTRSR